MKRIILSLLCLLMVFSLTACGNKENEEKLEKYGYLINCVENGNYDSAEYELQRIITETKKAPYVSDEYEEIEITIDNWKDYLEIKKNVNIFTDAFDEIESVSLLNCLYLKDEYANKTVEADIAVESEYTNSSYKWLSYNVETEVMSFLETTEKEVEGYYNDSSEKMTVKSAFNYDETKGQLYKNSLTSGSSISNSLKSDGNNVKIIVKDYETIHIVRIQGTIKVYK
ncbi:MAG: hypothetical protein U0L85_03695 [Bacilli bacterium]|nr:hypothetical protein [Bacilli bacterium]